MKIINSKPYHCAAQKNGFMRARTEYESLISNDDFVGFLRNLFNNNNNSLNINNVEYVSFFNMNKFSKWIELEIPDAMIAITFEPEYIVTTYGVDQDVDRQLEGVDFLKNGSYASTYMTIRYDFDEQGNAIENKNYSRPMFEVLNSLLNYKYMRYFYFNEQDRDMEVVFPGKLTESFGLGNESQLLIQARPPYPDEKFPWNKWDNIELPAFLADYEPLSDRFLYVDTLGPYQKLKVGRSNEILTMDYTPELYHTGEKPEFSQEMDEILRFFFGNSPLQESIRHSDIDGKVITYKLVESR